MSCMCDRCVHGKRVSWWIGRYRCDVSGKWRFIKGKLFCGGFERKAVSA